MASFARGDAVVIRGPESARIGRGLTLAYDDPRTPQNNPTAASSADIASIFGFSGRAEMIHRDDLVVSPE